MKKILALLLVAMMAIMPAMSMASGVEEAVASVIESGKAVNYEMSLTHGTLPEIDGLTAEITQVINDVIDAIGVRGYVQNGQIGGAIQLGGQDAVTADIAIDVENMAGYVTSNILKGSVIRLSMDDIAAANKFMAFKNYDEMVANGYITEEQAAELKAEYEQNAASPLDFQINMPDFSGVELESLTFDNTINFFMAQAEKAVVEQNEDGSMSITINVTGDDVVGLYDAVFTDLKANTALVEAIDSYIESVEGTAKIADLLDQALVEIKNNKDVLKNCEAVVEITAEGDLSSATLTLNIGENDDVMEMTLAYTCLDDTNVFGIEAVQNDTKVSMMLVAQCTEAEDVYVFSVENNDKEIIRLGLDWTKNHTENTINDQVVFAASLFSDDGQELSMTVTGDTAAQFSADNLEVTEVTKIFLGESSDELITISEHIYSSDAVAAVDAASAVKMADMTEETFNSFIEESMMNLQMGLIGILQTLPQSALQMLMGN